MVMILIKFKGYLRNNMKKRENILKREIRRRVQDFVVII